MAPTDPKHPARPFTFEPPGPGEWMLDTTHHGRRPASGYLRPIADSMDGMDQMLARYGLPIAGFDVRSVNGCAYLRPVAVGERGDPGSAPPVWLLKIVARLHPELRRRNRAAKRAWKNRIWRDDVDHWFDIDRAQVVETNQRFQAVDLTALDDAALLGHLADLTEHVRVQLAAGFATHGGDIVPVGDYLAHCAQWGVSASDAAELLRGSSPASTETARLLAPVADALAAAETGPTSIEGLRTLDPACGPAIDTWLSLHSWRLISSDDLDATTLAEQPRLQLTALLAAAAPPSGDPEPTAVRNRVPDQDQEMFDDLLAEARYGLRLRDDNVGVRWNWPVGLLRRALLEVGRRLVAAGRLDRVEHAIELDASEVGPLLGRGVGPTAHELADRRQHRLDVEAADPPTTLGDPEPAPPFDALPPAMARAARAVMATIDAMTGAAQTVPLQGVGIGDRIYRGTARVVSGSDDALDRLEPGDVLVASFTGPAYNSLLPVLGGIVVEEGGPMCHAAIVAREFGLPAVVGALEATSLIADGDEIEVDAAAGRVRVI
jgi:pyruvate,water dikinase